MWIVVSVMTCPDVVYSCPENITVSPVLIFDEIESSDNMLVYYSAYAGNIENKTTVLIIAVMITMFEKLYLITNLICCDNHCIPLLDHLL